MSQPQAIVVRSGEGRTYRQGPSLFKAAGGETGGRFDFFEMTIEYLTGPGLHYHFVQDDTFYVLEGVLAVQFGDEVVELSPGDFCTVPPGVPHTFDNIRKDQPPVKVINLMTPQDTKEFSRRTKRLTRMRIRLCATKSTLTTRLPTSGRR